MSKWFGSDRQGYIAWLYSLEKQIDAAHQHLRLALSIIRKEIHATETERISAER